MKKRFFSTKPAGDSWLIKCSQNIFRGSLLSLALLFLFVLPAFSAASIPASPADLYVLDQAGVMSADTRALILSSSQELARLTKSQVAVVTLKTLDNQVLEDVSLGILRGWGLGDKKLNNGVLILLVESDRKSRIEVGYGLEGALTDGKTGAIQDQYMLPYFKQGQYDLGLRNGYLAVVQEVAKEYGVTLSQNPDYKATPAAPASNSGQIPGWIKILGVFMLLSLIWLDHRYLNGFILGLLIGSLFRGGGGFGGGGGGGGGGFGGGSGGGGGSSRGW
jgi:uncharacterized protein